MSGLQYPGQRSDAWDAIGDLLRRVRALEANEGGGGGGASWLDLYPFSSPGPLSIFNGVAKQTALRDGEIDYIHVELGTAPTGSGATIRVNKNGSSIGTVTVAAGSRINTFVPSPAAFVIGDYFSLDCTAFGSTTPGTDPFARFILV